MISRIRLKNFKSFRDLDVELEPLSVLIGVNASGKSNLREAFRFLHGVGRGYSLIEILGEKWGEGGDLSWTGIRGGPSEVCFTDHHSFEIEVSGSLKDVEWSYGIAVSIEAVGATVITAGKPESNSHGTIATPLVSGEWLDYDGSKVFQASLDSSNTLEIQLDREKLPVLQAGLVLSRPLLSQLSHAAIGKPIQQQVDAVLGRLVRWLFLEPHPDAIRRPSFPGAPLGSHGENLGSAMLELFGHTPSLEGVFREYLQGLTPLDVKGFTFRSDQSGRVSLALRDQQDQNLSIASASDGTVRFLALLTASMQDDRLLFLEEIETGLHPSRLALLLEVLQQSVSEHGNQILVTSHSPLLLALLGTAALDHAYLTYRDESGTGGTTIRRFRDLPDAREVLETQDLARLHASGWFEDVSYFAESTA